MNTLSGEYDKDFEGEMKFSPKFFPDYFNRINFREINFLDFANFGHLRENKTRKIYQPRNFWNCIFGGELVKIAIFTWLFGLFAKLNPREIFQSSDSRN